MPWPSPRVSDAMAAWGVGRAVALALPGTDPRGTWCAAVAATDLHGLSDLALASFRCFKDKKRCSFSAAPPAGCDRCTKSGKVCTERDKSVTRKDLETIRKQGASGPAPPNVVGGPPFLPTVRQLPSPPPPWSPPPVPGFALRVAGPLTPRVSVDAPLPLLCLQSPSRTITWPASTSPAVEPDSLVLACLTHFWSDYHKLYPIIHRASFEAAFAPNAASPLYGPRPPLALLFAMAAIGARTSALGLSEMDKTKLCRAYCETSRDLILAGHFGSDPSQRPIGDLEALQTLLMLLQVFVGAGILGATAGAMLREAAGLVGRLRILDLDGLQPGNVPQSTAEWIRMESVLRAWITVSAYDVPFSYFADREPLLDFFPPRPFPLPCHESYYDNPDPEGAFFALFLSPTSAPQWTWVDFAPFFRSPDTDAGSRLVRQLVEPVFSGRASVHALWYLSMFFRSLRHRIRHLVVVKNLDPLSTVGRPTSELAAAETAFVAQTKLFDHMVGVAHASVPAPYGAQLWQGDALSFLSSWHLFFAQEGHAFQAVFCLASLRSYTLEHFFLRDGSAHDAGASLLRSPDFVPLLEAGIAFVGLLASQLGADPEGRHFHFGNAMPTLRVAGMNLAAIAVLRASPRAVEVDASPYADDLRVILRFLETVGKHYGVMTRRTASNFRRTLVAAGISTAAPPHPSAHVEEAEVPSEELGQSGTFRPAADPSSPGRTYAELMTEADRVGRKWSAVP
ncbi:hypothetical protein DFJ74DRAFT_443521 [Hyaloraphidium curvatum]|nr:hypothetical protein DFJ74DRAFT_443521 [Hyaloraphidium curvatum]